MFALYLVLILASGVFGEDIPDSIDYIVGGQPAELGEFPHVIILKYQGRFSCGGSLITPNRVLTAAHCVVDYLPGGSRTVEGLTITAGTINLESDGVIIPVESVHPHKDYNPADDFINDIAVIKLNHSVTLSKAIQTISLPFEQDVPAGGQVTVAGFGIYQAGGSRGHPASSFLRKVQVTAIDGKTCKKEWKTLIDDINIHSSQLCTTSQFNAFGVCNGDSGSGFIYKNQVVGVVSFGIAYCASGVPDVATRVASHLDFIREHLY